MERVAQFNAEKAVPTEMNMAVRTITVDQFATSQMNELNLEWFDSNNKLYSWPLCFGCGKSFVCFSHSTHFAGIRCVWRAIGMNEKALMKCMQCIDVARMQTNAFVCVRHMSGDRLVAVLPEKKSLSANDRI